MHRLHPLLRVALPLLVSAITLSCNSEQDNFYARLVVRMEGTGTGRVAVDYSNYDAAQSFNCVTAEGSCSLTLDLDDEGSATIIFTATADAGSEFAGWSRECIPEDLRPTESKLTMDEETGYECTATFDLVAAACTNPLVIEDPFTTDAGWTTTVSTTTANVTQAVSAQATGGNPGGFRQMQHIFTGLGAIAVFHTYGAVTYDPRTQGAIDHLNYFEDQIVLNPPAPGAAVGTGFSVTQGGTRYSVVLRPPTNAFTNTTWETTAALDLTAADFPGVDFSAAGGPITFGFFRSNTNSGGGALTLTHGVDNFKVEICR